MIDRGMGGIFMIDRGMGGIFMIDRGMGGMFMIDRGVDTQPLLDLNVIKVFPSCVFGNLPQPQFRTLSFDVFAALVNSDHVFPKYIFNVLVVLVHRRRMKIKNMTKYTCAVFLRHT